MLKDRRPLRVVSMDPGLRQGDIVFGERWERERRAPRQRFAAGERGSLLQVVTDAQFRDAFDLAAGGREFGGAVIAEAGLEG